MVVGPVGEHLHRPLPWPPAPPADRRDRLDQRHQLGDVVPVAAGQGRGQRDAASIGDHVVLGARPGPVDRAGTGLGPPFSARTCDPSAAARAQSITPAALSLASSTSCSRCHTPAACQSRSRRQQVIPDPYPSSCGKNSHGMPVYSTNKMPHSALRSSSRRRPGCRNLRSGLRQQRLDQLPQAVLDLPRPALRHASLLPDAHPSSKKQTTSDVILLGPLRAPGNRRHLSRLVVGRVSQR